MKKEIRNSNYELMRIISMLMIVLWHIILHANVLENASVELKLILTFIQAIIFVHVNSFILLSGYFMSTKTIKIKKIVKLFNQAWFYKIVITIAMVSIGLILTKIEFLKSISPFIYDGYWFINMFLILMLISPILNIVIKNVSKQQYIKIILTLFIIFSIITTFGNQEIYGNEGGYSLENFILLYFIGGYLRKYPLENNYIFRPISKNLLKIIFISIIFLLAIFTTMSVYFADSIKTINEYTTYLYEIIRRAFFSYDNPIIIIQSIIYFSLFGLFNLKSKTINYIATATLGVYLIHENAFLRPIIYKELLNFNSIIYTPNDLPRILSSAVLIFLVCTVIELIRLLIFKFLGNLKITKKLSDKTKKYIDSLTIKKSNEKTT